MKHSRRRGRSRRVRSGAGISGAIVRSLVFLALVAVCVGAIHWFSGGRAYNGELFFRPAASKTQDIALFSSPGIFAIQARNRRVVYPYSVVPGGVESPQELQNAASHDPAVATHYAGFNYNRARVVEVSEPRLVYLSYRRGNKVYWTRKQANLHKGEKLLTDGKITARTRCGNQVSVLPQSNTLPDEPLMAELDRPDALASGLQSFPSSLSSNLLNVDPLMPVGPSSSTGGLGGGPIAGGPIGGFIPPPLGGKPGGPPITSGCTPTPTKPCQSSPPPPPPPPPPPTPPPIPEPGTILLVGTGAAAVLARIRRTRR